MKQELERLIAKYRTKGILIDSNLLLLLYVGLLDVEFISKFKRTKIYNKDDFQALSGIVSSFIRIYSTPNILTEVSNLANSLTDTRKFDFFILLQKNIDIIEEEYLPSKSIAESDVFVKFGLTDSALIKLSAKEMILITDDFPVAQYIQRVGIDVINFNHVRQYLLTT